MESDSQLQISTPENIQFGYELADLGSRFQAAAIDTTAIMVLQVVAIVIAIFFAQAADVLDAGGWALGGGIALIFILFWGYYIVFELVWNGQTPGKRYIGLRVVDHNGVPVGLAASMIRNLVRIIDFIPIAYGAGIVTMFANKRALRLGDYAAGTMVIHDKNVTLETLDKLPKSPSLFSAPLSADVQNLPLHQLSQSDIELAETYLARRETLKTERQLIRPILQHLYDQMGVKLEDLLPYQDAVKRIEQIVQARRNAS